MNKNMNLPAEYAVLSEEEMTYTQGGSDIGGFATTAATIACHMAPAVFLMAGGGFHGQPIRNDK